MTNNNYIQHKPCLTKSIACDHDFWNTCIKWWYLQMFFFFLNFVIFSFLGGKRAKHSQRWLKKSVCCSWYLRNHISYDCHLWYTCVNDNISRTFFHFFKIFIFWIVRGVKGQKISQNDKKFYLSCLMYQKPYIMIVICGTQV